MPGACVSVMATRARTIMGTYGGPVSMNFRGGAASH